MRWLGVGCSIGCLFVALNGAYPLANQRMEVSLTGWIALFDGTSLAGWSQEQGARWRVSAGAIVSAAGTDGWLRSNRQFSDFLLRIEFKNSPKGNSGIFLRATKESNPTDPSNPSGGYELQINNEDEHWATGSIENFIPRLIAVTPAPGEWHAYDVEVHGDHLMASLDGIKVLDGHDTKFKTGYIGLQHHKDSRIDFRKITIKPLAD